MRDEDLQEETLEDGYEIMTATATDHNAEGEEGEIGEVEEGEEPSMGVSRY